MDDAAIFIDALLSATNAQDIDALVGCFADGYRNETPAHPSRSFTGRDQVRRNWEQIFGFVPDLHATVTAVAVNGTTAWTEWEMSGTRRDGSPHRMRGVILFELTGRRAAGARFYLEPVDGGAADVTAAVAAQVHADTPA